MEQPLLFYIVLLVLAFLYAVVGHGGASGYLALMALYGISPDVMKPTALLLNLFVSLTAFMQFYRAGYFKWSLFFPIAITSIPMAFLGGMAQVDAGIYKKLLGVLLCISIARLLVVKEGRLNDLRPASPAASGLIGAGIGWISGMIGIGGGILLSPLLLLLRWTDQKQTAAISALFIFVNSLAGLAGQFVTGIQFSSGMILYVCIALLGGLIGAYTGARIFQHAVIRFVLAAVLLIAASKLLFTAG